jgi:hypothetical protein
MMTVKEALAAHKFLSFASEKELFLMWENLDQKRVALILKQLIYSDELRKEIYGQEEKAANQ